MVQCKQSSSCAKPQIEHVTLSPRLSHMCCFLALHVDDLLVQCVQAQDCLHQGVNCGQRPLLFLCPLLCQCTVAPVQGMDLDKVPKEAFRVYIGDTASASLCNVTSVEETVRH